MKPKETQILGLLIILLISLIVFDLYTIYCITSYIKLTSLDVTTSFAVIDALFYQSIKLIIMSYGIFALSVEIRGIYILRNRRNSKLITKMQKGQDRRPSEPVKHEHSYTLQDVLDEAKLQETASDLSFRELTPTYDLTLVDKYGIDALSSLTRGQYLNLSVINIEAQLKSLKQLRQFYINTSASGVADEYIKYFNNCEEAIKTINQISI